MKPLSSKDFMAMHVALSKDFVRRAPAAGSPHPAEPPQRVRPAYTLQKKGTGWLLIATAGRYELDSDDEALRLVQSVSPDCGSDVRMLDAVGPIYRVIQVPPASQAPPPSPAPIAKTPALRHQTPTCRPEVPSLPSAGGQYDPGRALGILESPRRPFRLSRS